MRRIAILVMKMMLTKAKTDRFKCDHSVVRSAYDNMIKNYETTLLYLRANK